MLWLSLELESTSHAQNYYKIQLIKLNESKCGYKNKIKQSFVIIKYILIQKRKYKHKLKYKIKKITNIKEKTKPSCIL